MDTGDIAQKRAIILVGRKGERMENNNGCPHCGSWIIYQDRVDSRRGVAHCDDCGEELTKDEYERIYAQQGGGADRE